MRLELDEGASVAVEDGPRAGSGCTRSREALAEACRPCPEKEGAMRREHLCRCPVALGLRLLVRVERFGPDPTELTASERASLDYQERALARRLPPIDASAVKKAGGLLCGAQHANCEVPGCLQCRAARILDALAEVAP